MATTYSIIHTVHATVYNIQYYTHSACYCIQHTVLYTQCMLLYVSGTTRCTAAYSAIMRNGITV